MVFFPANRLGILLKNQYIPDFRYYFPFAQRPEDPRRY